MIAFGYPVAEIATALSVTPQTISTQGAYPDQDGYAEHCRPGAVCRLASAGAVESGSRCPATSCALAASPPDSISFDTHSSFTRAIIKDEVSLASYLVKHVMCAGRV